MAKKETKVEEHDSFDDTDSNVPDEEGAGLDNTM